LRQKLDIHNWRRRYERALQLLKQNNRISESNRQNILRFLEDGRAKNLSIARRVKYLYTLPVLAQRLVKNFQDAELEDIRKLVAEINDDPRYAEWTKSSLRVGLKRFYRWLRGLPPGQNPPETAWIRGNSVKNRILPEELLNEDDISSLLKACENSRDRAFVLTLYELGGRIGEVLSLRRKHVTFDTYGAVLLVSGKTGDRRVKARSRLISGIVVQTLLSKLQSLRESDVKVEEGIAPYVLDCATWAPINST
jgi:integrase/recombinase XerD